VVGLSKNVARGGLMATGIRLLFEIAPAAANYLKLSPVRTPVYNLGNKVDGMNDWMELRGMGFTGGLGTIGPNVNEALIAGESFAQSVSQFHGMGDMLELQGMGNNRIPMQDLMQGMGSGYPGQYGAGTYDPYHVLASAQAAGNVSGLGDWVQMIPGTAPAEKTFVPAMETF
jgi:hypothetical protein